MKSSSTPPAVVTMAETCLCWTRYRSVSRRPEEIRLDVYPRKIVVPSLVAGSFHARCHLLAGSAKRRSAGETMVSRCYFRLHRFDFRAARLAWAQRLSPHSDAAAAGNVRQTLTMSLIMRTASATEVAWNPMFANPATSSSTVMLRFAYWLKSMPCTSLAPSGTGSEGFNTASVAPDGAAASAAVDMTSFVGSHGA